MQLRATNYRIDQVEKTPSGSLRVRGKLTKSGVFEYQRGDSVVRERRGDAEVFDPKSLDTLRGAHVTLDHPMDFVDSENWKLHSIGTVISAEADPPYVVGELVVHDSRVQHQIEQGYLKEISCGYFCKPVPVEDGTADVSQTEILYNHAALGPVGWGRLGKDVGLTLDSAGDQKLNRFLHGEEATGVIMSEDQTPEVVEDSQDKLQDDNHPPLRELVTALAAKVDLIAQGLSKTVDKAEKPYTEISKKPSADELQERIDARAEDKLVLELRARSAYEAIYPTRKTIDTVTPVAQALCEEVLCIDSEHGYQLRELVERAEIAAITAKREREAIQQQEDAARMATLLGEPYTKPNSDPLRAYILGE